MRSYWDAIAIGAMTGLRSMSGPAAVAHRLNSPPKDRPSMGVVSRRTVATVLKVAALGEMAVDKVPGIPARTEPGSLAARAVFAALSATAQSDSRSSSRYVYGAIASASAIASAIAATTLRRRLTREVGIRDIWVALVEDVVALMLAARIAKMI